ncbi:uncharacterized protein LOC108234834 isoform X2 [Kryptolebias marmoratus]|uniref:uncharacterized protein LOC108234834 isoform X2 n=1 Tax=Kryptolebias marmoratus TaxID=37003 RepID=UPI000D531123|nr:uncharacterized protein LOC108234834 isoform X2 [Kryptolebias marmoratus]
MSSGSRRTHVRRKISAGDWPSSKTRHTIMEDRSPTQSFSNLQHHRHRPAFPLTVHSFQSSDVGYPASQPGPDSLEQYGSRGEEFLTSNPSSGPRKGSSGSDRVFLTAGGGSLEGDASIGGHFGGDSRLGGHFDDSWYGRKGIWEDGEHGESAAEDFHGKGNCYGNTNDVFCTMSCATQEGDRWRIRSNNNSYVSWEAKSDYNKEANASHLAKQTAAYNRGGAGSFNDRAESKMADHYLGGEEDYGSSCGSGEDQLQPADAEASWLSVSPTGEAEVRGQAGGRWRGPANVHGLSSGYGPQSSPVGLDSRTYTQKLDSFSDAFLSQRKMRFQAAPSENSPAQIWENGVGRGESAGLIKSRQSCAFDSDSYLPPSSSSSSPACLSLPSFPSPPASSHLMSSVLSPPPTPLPPPSHSPSKTDSPSSQGGAGPSVPQGGESLGGGLQFFPSRIHPLPSAPASGMIWKFPLLSHCFPQPSVDLSDTERSMRSSQGDDSGGVTAPPNIPPSPESSSFPSPSASLHSSRAPCPAGGPSPRGPFHLPFRSSHLFGKHPEATEKPSPHRAKSDAADLNQQHLQQQSNPVYSGKPFPSILHSRRAHIRGHYTPRPLLNPARGGTGLHSSLSSRRDEEGGEEDEQRGVLPYVNVGPDFQAELPPCFVEDRRSKAWFPEEAPPREELLWKPWDELQESAHVQGQVEKLLSVCSSSCLPGGGSNTELALHCLHYCHGNTMATLEMLLFSQPSPTGSYHYSGCDFWTNAEKSLFGAAFGKHGKDFSLIEKTVRTKTASQCVEFYYLSKKLVDKQKKQKEDECRDAELELQKRMASVSQPLAFSLEEAASVPSMANFFPCKLCGKMFYKIKSRNAHMKIHRQPQEDWSDRRLQHQLLTQRLALGRPNSLIPGSESGLLPAQASALTFPSCGLASTSSSSVHSSVTNSVANNNVGILDPGAAVTYSNVPPQNSHLIAISNANGGDRKDPVSVLPFHQPWGSFGPPPDLSTFYCFPEGKEDVGAEVVEGKETIGWQ